MKTSKEVMRELLEKSPSDRAAFKPADGFEEVAKLYLEQAMETKDAAMLKYVIELVEERAAAINAADIETESPVARFSKTIKGALEN